MSTPSIEAKTILGYVYAVTDKDHYLLLQSGAELPQVEQELMIRINGRTTEEQLIADMAHIDAFLTKQTLLSLLERGAIMKSDILLPEDTSLDFTDNLDRPLAPVGLHGLRGDAIRLEAVRGTSALDERGYYICIGRRRAALQPPRNGSVHSVLIIEDDAKLAKLLRTLLESEGFLVGVAHGKEEVLMSLSLTPLPDLVLLDVMLPDINGFQLLAKMRTHRVFCEIPVVMLTGRASREDVLQGLAGGADGYITKPFDLDRVVNVVRDVLGEEQGGGNEENH